MSQFSGLAFARICGREYDEWLQIGRYPMKAFTTFFAIVSLFLFLADHSFVSGAVQTGVKVEQQLQPAAKPGMIYVSDFALEVSAVIQDNGVLGHRGILIGERLVKRGPLQRQEDPTATASNLVNLLATSIAQELSKNLIPAMRLPRDQSLPDSGWLVRGEFLEVDEGNRLRRAVIGFGEGASDMQIEFEVCDLGRNPLTPFLASNTETGSGKKPGAIVTMNPYVAATKFVLSKNASESDVKRAGSEIAAEIMKYMKAHGLFTGN